MPVVLTVYDGAGAIGGNKILLESNGARLFLDFGTCFATRSLFFEEFLRPRAVRGLADVLHMGLLPPLRGIYREDLEPSHDDIWSRQTADPAYRELTVDGVLLSHAHVDHSGYISFLRGDIPVACSSMTLLIARAMQDTGQPDFEREVCYFSPRDDNAGILGSGRQPYSQRKFFVTDAQNWTAGADAFWRTCPYSRRGFNVVEVTPCDSLAGMRLRSFAVDHSIYGASAFAVDCADGTVVYTGDLRMHGRRGELTRWFAQEVGKLQPLVLICEGTQAEKEVPVTEAEVFENCLRAVRRARTLVVADFGPRNVERIEIFREIAGRTGRRLVLLAKDVYLLEAMRRADGSVPDPLADDMMVLYHEARGRPAAWEQGLLSRYRAKLVSPLEIRRNQGAYILCFSFFDLNELIDVMPDPGGVYIYSTSEAYTEEQRIDLQRLRNWLGRFGMALVGDPERGERGFHASGHATGPDLAAMVEMVRPKWLVPVHTECPELFITRFSRLSRVVIPQKARPLEIR